MVICKLKQTCHLCFYIFYLVLLFLSGVVLFERSEHMRTTYLSHFFTISCSADSNVSSRTQPSSPFLVQVHTNLPPGIDAPTTAYLNLSISLFRATQSILATKRRGPSRKPPDELSVRVRWWGEPSTGDCAVFNPRLAHKVGHKQNTATRARYRITVPLERFGAYLKGLSITV